MVTWKEQPAQYGGGSSCFGADFAKGEPAIAKQLCNASGAFEDKKQVAVNGYSYRVKIVPKKDGSGSYTFIERKQTYVGLGDEKPEVTAAKAVQKEFADKSLSSVSHEAPPFPVNNSGFDQRQKDIALAHQENMTASKELASAILVLANEVQGIKHLLEIVVNNSDIVKNTFKTADKMEVKTGGGNNTA